MKRFFTLFLGVVILFSAVHIIGQDVWSQTAPGHRDGQAVVPRLVRFSGMLKDAAGQPLHGAVEVSFLLYKEEAAGEPLWFETQTVEADAQGRYSVLLGAMHPDGLPIDLFTSGEARWLGVSVGRLPEQQRVLLVAVPYALKAADADTLGGKPATAFVASDQLKEQVQSEVKAQVTESTSTVRTLVGTAPTPQAIRTTSPATFTCATSGVCVQTAQSGEGGIALRAVTQSSTGNAGIFDNLGGGKILSGRTAGYVEKFYVDSGGNIWTGGSLTANSFSGTSGAAVFGAATAGSGTTYGVRGQTVSPSGTGVFGYATSPTGPTYGLLGSNLSTSGTGLSGSASSLTGNTIGVRAVTQSPNSTAAIFDNLGGGKLISARTAGYVEKFSVDGNGNVRANVYLDLAGNPIPASLATDLNCVGCVSASEVSFNYAGSANQGGPATNALALGGVAPTGYATVGSNSFSGPQTISSGDLSVGSGNISLSQTTPAGTGVINLGGNRFMHACCSATNYNTFVGAYAGSLTSTGGYNTATGSDALHVNGVGNWNTANGADALFQNTAGAFNTASGGDALYYNTDGVGNTAIGYYALAHNCNGVSSGCAGHQNTAVGYAAGMSSDPANANVTGTDNTFLGAYSGPGTSTPLHNATAIGHRAQVSVSNALVLGGTGSNLVSVGIGTATPSRELEVNGGVRLNTTKAKPACDSTTRGTIWITLGGAGVADLVEVCTKDQTEAYLWRSFPIALPVP